jgi:hypothetical protein
MTKLLKLPNGLYIDPNTIITVYPEYRIGKMNFGEIEFDTSYISITITTNESYVSTIPLSGWQQVNLETQANSIKDTYYKTYKFEDKDKYSHAAKDLIIKLNELELIDFDFEKDCDDRR